MITGLALTTVKRLLSIQTLQRTANTDLFDFAGSITRENDDNGSTHHQYEKPVFQTSARGIDRTAGVFGLVQYQRSGRGRNAKAADSGYRPFGPVC